MDNKSSDQAIHLKKSLVKKGLQFLFNNSKKIVSMMGRKNAVGKKKVILPYSGNTAFHLISYHGAHLAQFLERFKAYYLTVS